MASKENIREEYASSLCDLTINSKPLINMLTMLAEDYIDNADTIVNLIERQIASVEPDVKLPLLYLIDSIVKNVGKSYVELFTKVLVPIFTSVFEVVDEKIRSQMFKLRQTWTDVFPNKKLYALDARVHALDPAWPILASIGVHVNPKFLVKEETVRDQLLLKTQKELLELQQKQVQLELLKTKAILEEQQKKLVEEGRRVEEVAKEPLSSLDPIRNIDDSRLNLDVQNLLIDETRRNTDTPNVFINDPRRNLDAQVNPRRALDVPAAVPGDPRRNLEAPTGVLGDPRRNLDTQNLLINNPRRNLDGQATVPGDPRRPPDTHSMLINDPRRNLDQMRNLEPQNVVINDPRRNLDAPSIVINDPRRNLEAPSLLINDLRRNLEAPISLESERNLVINDPRRNLEAPAVLPDDLRRNLDAQPVVTGDPRRPIVAPEDPRSSPSDDPSPDDDLILNEPMVIDDDRGSPELPPAPPPPIITPDELPSTTRKRPRRQARFKDKARKRHKHRSPVQDVDFRPLFGRQDIDLRPKRRKKPQVDHCSTIMRQAEEQLTEGHISFSEYNRTLKQVMELNEERKLNEVRTPKRRLAHPRLPPTDPEVLQAIAADPVQSIQIDGQDRDIRFYDDVAVVLMSWEEPRQISFLPGSRRLMIDADTYLLTFNEPYVDIYVDGFPHKVKLGAPTRELYIDGAFYQLSFGVQSQLLINGRVRNVLLEGPAPGVHLGPLRTDLIVGKINLIIDAKHVFPVYLDAKPQIFTVNGLPYILRFVEGLQTVVLNGVPFKFEYGGFPVPVEIDGEEHYLRLSVLPKSVRPGCVNIYNMEGAERVSEPPRARAFDSVELLSSLTSSTSEAQATGLSYQTESGNSTNSTNSTVDIGQLLQKLVAVGIVPAPAAPSSSESIDAESYIAEQDFSASDAFKVLRRPLVKILYSGMQCSSCGIRFSADATVQYSNHLDWHFRQNRRDRSKSRTNRSRKWYYGVSDWAQFTEIEESEASVFEGGPVEEGAVEEDVPTVPVNATDGVKACVACRDEFEQVYNQDGDVWVFRNCVLASYGPFHPACLDGYVPKPPGPDPEPLPASDLPPEVIDLDNSSIPDEIWVPGPSPSPLSPSPSPPSPSPATSPFKENPENSDPTPAEESEDDIIQVEVLTPKIESYTIDSDSDDHKENDEPVNPNLAQSPELDMSQVVVKQEKDSLTSSGILTSVTSSVTSAPPPMEPSIDGNVTYQPPPRPPPPTRKIKITLKRGEAVEPGAGETAAAAAPTDPTPAPAPAPVPTPAPSEHNDHLPHPSLPLPTLEPLPPGEEPLPSSLKPALIGLNLKQQPVTSRGSELSSLCSIQ